MRRGFTLIELLVVISIIALLSTIVLASVTSARVRARDAQRQTDISRIQLALDLYYGDYNQFPASGGASAPGGGWTTSNDDSWEDLEAALQPYLSQLPEDPEQSASGWPGTAGRYAYSYYSRAYGCDLQWYMIVWRPEAASVASPGVTTCNGTTFNYGGGTVTIGSGR